jgi:hypothetical protein
VQRRHTAGTYPGQLTLGLLEDPRDILQLVRKDFEDSGSRLVPEFDICQGSARIDLAVVSDRLDGFEIKSDRDSLDRLPRQAEHFGRVFDRLTLVGSPRHLASAERTLPAWWGLSLLAQGSRQLVSVRPAEANPGVEVAHRVRLLWRDEVVRALAEHGGTSTRGTRHELWRQLAEVASADQVRELVCRAIRSRPDWRAAS